MTIRLHKENDQRHALTVFFAQLNKLRKESWQLLLLNVRAPDVPFQLSFEVRKIGDEHFWIAIDDIDILSGRCPKEPIAVSRATASFSGIASMLDESVAFSRLAIIALFIINAYRDDPTVVVAFLRHTTKVERCAPRRLLMYAPFLPTE
uniref:MAM domain-containing protein n=1 Tax=Ascaris lumbricoides TaxID=6252 RepID=A0A0M3IJZ3_ASCLU